MASCCWFEARATPRRPHRRLLLIAQDDTQSRSITTIAAGEGSSVGTAAMARVESLPVAYPPMPNPPEMQRLVIEALHSLGGRADRKTITRRVMELGEFTHEQLQVECWPYVNRVESLAARAMSAALANGDVFPLEGGDWVLMSPRP